MAIKELNLIESLINEDENFCSSNQETPTQDISSWNFENFPSSHQKSWKKPAHSSLPPIIRHKKSRTSIENISTGLSNAKQELSQSKTPKLFEILNKVKITEFKSLEEIVEKFNEAPNRNQFRPSVQSPKLKSYKKSKNSNLITSESHKISIELSNIDFNSMHIPKEKKTKKIIGLAYPPSYYEKFFINANMVQTAKNQLNSLNLEKNLKFSEFNKKNNIDSVNSLLKKLRIPKIRSKSTLLVLPELSLRNKYLFNHEKNK